MATVLVNRRTWSFSDVVQAIFWVLTLSLGFIAGFPYDRVILGPLTGVGGFVILTVLVVIFVYLTLMTRHHSWLRDSAGSLLLVLVIISIIVLRVHWTPMIDAQADRDEALDVAWRGLFGGGGPYSTPTPIGNAISPLLGGVLLFTPFEVTHLTELFDVMAIVGLGLLLGRVTGWRAAVAALTVFFFSAPFRWEVLIQSDGWINAGLVILGVLWAGKLMSRIQSLKMLRVEEVIATALLILALSYRAYFFVILFPFAVYLVRQIPKRIALVWLSIVFLSALLLSVLPIAIWPSPYGPQHVRDFVGVGEYWIPVVVVGVVLGSVLLVLVAQIETLAGVLCWTGLALSCALFLLGLGQFEWAKLLDKPLEAISTYPPPLLKPFGSYALTANNAGILLMALVSLVLPRQWGKRETARARVDTY